MHEIKRVAVLHVQRSWEVALLIIILINKKSASLPICIWVTQQDIRFLSRSLLAATKDTRRWDSSRGTFW